MTPNFVGPYWTLINYHGTLAPHSHVFPTKNWNPGSGGGTFDIWSGGTISAVAMITDMVDKLRAMYPSDTQYDNYTIYKQLLPDDDPQPVYSGAFTGKTGTNTDGSWSSAIEKTFIARSATFGIAKIVCLDADFGNSFNPRTTMNVAEDALFTEWTADSKGWCARDNAQVTTFMKITLNLNQKLRKEYRYT